ncbi:electron transport complex subunit RsxC [Wansuia hejianensis]|uniref:Ion-translocating oxidoreductase complex subunit C n=1 Tax=Wansuia hejianensis TaxID=2763667 RepID=A0A926IMP4_9FIRM|nr:electron transport complex subunit RsxC [Wansuia hejianensis]MBC8590836.1 electron transport complex subunit RsxC [Wansuia hejianensis]
MRRNNLTFKGGVRLNGNRELSRDKSIEVVQDPKFVYIPLHQHVGAPCKALVKVGDNVKVGQKIGDSEASLTAPVHASVSGVVKGIEKRYTPDGYNVECVVIESDGLNETHESVKPRKDVENLSGEEIVNIIREAGIVGMGGAAFPTHSKMTTSKDGNIDTIILNGAECEPFLTCDFRVMLERSEQVISGLELLMKYFGLNSGYIGIEDDKLEAIEKLESVSKSTGKEINVVALKSKFPQGDSYRIVNSVTGRIVPKGGRCKDVNTMVSNVGTAVAITEAVYEGKPLYERIITVSGNGIKEPKNLLVKIGTTIEDIIAYCGGFNGKPGKIIAGGPMTGHTQFTLDTPITKGTTGIIVFTEAETKPEKVYPCIKCGKCIEVCPVNLQPNLISGFSLKGKFENTEKLNAEACIGCGACTYICPSKRPLTESIAHAKREINANRKSS